MKTPRKPPPPPANDPDDPSDEDAAGLGRELFLPIVALAVLTAGWAAFCWYLKGNVADAGVVKGLTIMSLISAALAVVWVVAAWFLRPRRS